MALKFENRVKETSTTTGEDDMVLLGAMAGFVAFGYGFNVTDGDEVQYLITMGDDWEIGQGVYHDLGATRTLERTTVHTSSDSNFRLVLGAGTKEVALIQSAVGVISGNAHAVFNKGYHSGIVDLDYTDEGGGVFTCDPIDALQSNIFRIFVPEGTMQIPSPLNLSNGEKITLIIQSFVTQPEEGDPYEVTFSSNYLFGSNAPDPLVVISYGAMVVIECQNLNGYLLSGHIVYGAVSGGG